jgi:SAM-dependent methyltransferase
LNSKELFEKFFTLNKKYSYSKSLFIFYTDSVQPLLSHKKLNLLDMGSGHYSFFEDVINIDAEITAIDFSKNAIKNAPQSSILYREGNVIDPTFFPDHYYDLIFDSHCLNCLTSKEERQTTFKNIYSGLANNGLFASEMMVQPTDNNVSMDFKWIPQASEIEQELISHGFKIKKFMIANGMSFSHQNKEGELQCDLLQIIGEKIKIH